MKLISGFMLAAWVKLLDRENSIEKLIYIATEMTLQRSIQSPDLMPQWFISPAYKHMTEYLDLVCRSVRSVPKSILTSTSTLVNELSKCMDSIQSLIISIPPVHSESSFGNPSYRTFLTELSLNCTNYLSKITSDREAVEYLVSSFGSKGLMEFGTGHELNFLAFLTVLWVQGVTKDGDARNVFDLIMWKYWECLILLKDQYNPAPAGSQGSWGYDDYVMLPFVIGSSQLCGVGVSPSSVLTTEVAKEMKNRFIYAKWIDYLHRCKPAPFAVSCRMLASLGSMPGFDEIAEKMKSEYAKRVLGRFVVVQHFGFGHTLRFGL